MATIPSDAFKARVASTKRLYESAGQKGNDEYYEEEAVCDWVGEWVGKSDILSHLKRNADYKVLGWMHSVAKSIMGVLRRGDNEYQKFSEAEKAFRQAYLDAVNREAGNATDTNGEQRKSVRKDVVKEMEDIIAKAKADGTYMKAPNGKPSNLSPTQWAIVRTKAFKKWFGDWELAFKKNFLLNGKAVSSLNGDEFGKKEGVSFKEQVIAYFEAQGGLAKSIFGDVILDARGVKNSMGHGLSRMKSSAFASVKDVLEKGIVIMPMDYYHVHGKKQQTGMIAAPVMIDGKRYICVVEVIRNKKDNRLYTHEVTLQEKLLDVRSNPSQSQSEIPATNQGVLAKVLQKIVTDKENCSKVVDKNGEPRVVYHGTPGGRFSVFGEQEGNFDAYTRNGMYFFTASPVVADGYSTKSHYKDDGTNDKDGHRDMTIDASEIEIHERRDRYSKNPDKVIGYEAYYNGEYIPDSDAKSREDAMKKAMKSVARNYYPADSRVFEAFMNLRNPYIVDAENGNWRNVQYPSKEELTNRGHDGVVIENVDDSAIAVRREISTDYIALEPTQIKSATENEGTFGINNKDIRKSVRKDIASETIDEVNRRFNDELIQLTEENKDKVVLSLGRPSAVLLAAGVYDKPMKLYGNKVIKKMKKHGFTLAELQNLPRAVADPIAVFDNIGREGNRSILTELRTEHGNFLVTVDLGKDADIDFNIVSSVFGKGSSNVIDWINKGFATYINKEKTLAFLSHPSALIAAAAANEELLTATKIVKDFLNPKVNDEHFSVEDENNNDTHTRKSIRQSAEEAASAYKEEAERPKPLVSAILHSIRGGKRNVPIDPFVEGWDSIISSDAFKLEETSFDSLKAVEEFQRYMTGSKDVPDYLNAHRALMVLSSVNKAQMDMFEGTYVENLRKAIEEMVGTAEMNKGFYAEDGALAELDRFLKAQHGLERNRDMRVRAKLSEIYNEKIAEAKYLFVSSRFLQNHYWLEG